MTVNRSVRPTMIKFMTVPHANARIADCRIYKLASKGAVGAFADRCRVLALPPFKNLPRKPVLSSICI